jgi:hypothetical protein
MKRFLLDDDGWNFFGNLGEDVAADVAEVVRECPPQVTTYLVCCNAGTSFWPTRVGCVTSRFSGLGTAHQRGMDPLGMWLQRLKAAGKETFLSFRMNDVHHPTDADAWNTPRLRRENPDCIVGLEEVRSGKPKGWMSWCMDYTRQDVRDYQLSLIRELVELYGGTIDGLQLDWMRFPRHLSGTPEQVWEKRQVLTEFTAEVRKILDASGRRILLGARVPTSPAGCHYAGMDLAEWTRRGLVDLLVVCPFLTTDWQIPVREFRGLLGGAAIPIYAGFDLGFGPQVHFPESLRGICTSLYDGRPDGLYLFNVACWIERLAARPYHWLTGLQDPKTAAAKPLLLSVNHQRSRVEGVDQPPVIPVVLAPGASATVPLHVPAGALPSWRAMGHVECGADLTLEVNGLAAPRKLAHDYGAGPYRSEVFVEFVNHYRPKTLRAVPADCRQFRVDPASLRPGENLFVFRNPTSTEARIERLNLALW